MKTVKLRRKAGALGLVIEAKGDGWLVTNMGTAKSLRETPAATLEEVEVALADVRTKVQFRGATGFTPPASPQIVMLDVWDM